MNNSKFELKSIAYADIETIADYIAQNNKIAAKNLVEKFYNTFELICSQPKCGRILDRFPDKSVRFFVAKNIIL